MTSADYISSIFTFGRTPPFPAIYPELKTAVTVDVLEVGWIVAFITGYISFIILLPAMVGFEKVWYFVRITLISFIGLAVMLCNFGQEWEVGTVKSKMFYKAGSHTEINGTVGIKLGLRSVNITLYADPESLQGDLVGEKINYNERFTWTWDQGRAGFGPFAGRIQQEYREAQLKGSPFPILWVAEFFTIDGEGLRFGRRYRHAGWYAHISVWCASVAWVLSIILFKTYIRYGAFMLSLLGCFLLIASLIWCSVRNFIELAVVFNNEDSGVLRTHFGFHWYLALIVGIFCILAGIVIAVLDKYFHNELCKFFGVDPFLIIDEDYEDSKNEVLSAPSNNIEMQETANNFQRRNQRTVVYKARGTKKYWKKSISSKPDVENTEYFNLGNNPTSNPDYLDIQFSGSDRFQASNSAFVSQEFQRAPAVIFSHENYVAMDEGQDNYAETGPAMHQQREENRFRLPQQQPQQPQQRFLQPRSYGNDNSQIYMNLNEEPVLPPKPSTKKLY